MRYKYLCKIITIAKNLNYYFIVRFSTSLHYTVCMEYLYIKSYTIFTICSNAIHLYLLTSFTVNTLIFQIMFFFN